MTSASISISFTASSTSTPTTLAPSAEPSYSPQFLDEWSGSYPTAACVAFMILCPSFVALRFVARRLNRASWGWDDWLIFPALISVLASQSCDMALIHAGGIGRHVAYWESYDPGTVTTWLKLAFVVEFWCLLCICLTKLALLSIYLRVIINKRDRIICWILVSITLAAWFAQSVACVLQCIPFEYQWDKTIPGGSCFNQQEFYEYLSVGNLVTDVVMLILPIPTIMTLKIGKHQKIALGVVFLTGSLGFVASILRFVTYFRVDLLSDVTFKSGQLLLWTIIEPGMYLISACLPTMRPLLTKTLQAAGLVPRAATETRSYNIKRSPHATMSTSKNIFGDDNTPLADGSTLELTGTATMPTMRSSNSMSMLRRGSATGTLNAGTVVTHISSAGRHAEEADRDTVIKSRKFFNNPNTSLESIDGYDVRLGRSGEFGRGIMVTTDMTVER